MVWGVGQVPVMAAIIPRIEKVVASPGERLTPGLQILLADSGTGLGLQNGNYIESVKIPWLRGPE